MSEDFDAVVVGAGPNGLAAATVLADAGLSVLVLERSDTIGGGARTAELTEPGFHHDVCSAIHPMGAASPYLRALPLEEHGLRWLHPEVALAHPLPDGSAAIMHRSLDATCEALGADGEAYRRLFAPLVARWPAVFEQALRPLRIPTRPLLMARFGLRALRSCDALVRATFETEAARALFAGSAAHSITSIRRLGTAAFGLMLNLAGHARGWPCAEGGSQRITDALAAYLRARGGEVRTSVEVRSLDDVPPSRAVLFDVTPRQLSQIAGEALSARYRRQLARFRHGPGVFKLDWALDGPIPWTSEACRGAGTVHVAGTYEELATSAETVASGGLPERPFVLVGQQSVFDPSRAPAGKHTGWAYCHVPNGADVDMTERIEAHIERFAPGFRDRILARHAMAAADVEARNPNNVGGDIGGGANTLWQLVARPALRWNPYTTPNPRLFLCSSSTPPGAGVHGMCGYWAARAALAKRFGRRPARALVTSFEDQ